MLISSPVFTNISRSKENQVMKFGQLIEYKKKKKKKKKLYGPFLWMGFNCLKAAVRGGSLLFTTKFPETPGTPGTLSKWFNNNFMKANSSKNQLLLSFSEPSRTVTDGCSIESNIKEVLLGITINRNLKFDDHVKIFVKKHVKNLMLSHALHPL